MQKIGLFLVLFFVVVVSGEDEIRKVAEMRKKLPPSIQWQFPEDDYTFHIADETLVSFVVHNFNMPEAGKIRLELNSQPVGEWDMPPNEFGESRIHIGMPQLGDGEYYAVAILVDPKGESIGVEHECIFRVDTSTPKPVGQASEDDMCHDAGMCKSDAQCSGHGRCHKGACICDPHWIGEYCDFDLFELPRFHPTPDPLSSPSRCERAFQFENGSRLLVSELERINFPEVCDESTVMLFEAPSHGLGANLHYLTVAMTRAIQQNKAMVLRPPPHMPVWLYGWHDECKVKGHGCHFHPWTNCTGNEPPLLSSPVNPRNDFSYPPDSRFRPSSLLHQDTLWYRSMLIHYLLQPNRDLEAKIRKHRNVLNIQHPIIGMHIRAGDACAHAATSTIRPECRSIESYVKELQLMSEKYGVKRVFLACDDAPSAQVISSLPNLEVTMLPMDRSMFDGKWFIEYRMAYGATNTAQVAESTMIDLFLLRECDYFVGTFASQFSRLAFEMMVAYKGYVPPYASVDYPYCFNYMEKMRLGVFGSNFC